MSQFSTRDRVMSSRSSAACGVSSSMRLMVERSWVLRCWKYSCLCRLVISRLILLLLILISFIRLIYRWVGVLQDGQEYFLDVKNFRLLFGLYIFIVWQMQTKALKTLMMVSEQTTYQHNWELSPQGVTLCPPLNLEPKRDKSNLSFYQRPRNPKPQPKQAVSENKLQLASKEVSFEAPYKDKPTHSEVIKHRQLSLGVKKQADKRHFSHIFRKKYLLQNYKALTRCDTLNTSRRSDFKTKEQNEVGARSGYDIKTMPVDEATLQTHHCFRNQMIRQLLNERGGHFALLKSKAVPKFATSSIVITRKKGRESKGQARPKKSSEQSRINMSPARSVPKKSKAFYIKNFVTRTQPKNLFKVHSLSII